MGNEMKIRVQWTYEFEVNPDYYAGCKTDEERFHAEIISFEIEPWIPYGKTTFEIIDEKKPMTHEEIHKNKYWPPEVLEKINRYEKEYPGEKPMTHTPTPWTVGNPGVANGSLILGSNNVVADTNKTADAAFIVRACNAHEKLLANLKWLHGKCRCHEEQTESECSAQAAIALAEDGQYE